MTIITSENTAEYLQALSERPSAPLRTDTFRQIRPGIAGPDTVEPPFPIFLSGAVQKGFGRGGKDLGCPTGEPSVPVDRLGSILFDRKRTFPMNL